MTILELYTFLLPLINVLGTICLIALVAGGTLYVLSWIIRKIWKYVLTLSALSFCILMMYLVVTSV